MSPALATSMPERRSDPEVHTLADAGNWVPHEKSDELTARFVDWLRERF